MSEHIVISEETARLIAEANKLVSESLDGLTTEQLIEVCAYMNHVEGDYQERYQAWRQGCSQGVSTPDYRKLSGYEGRDWEGSIEGLFTERDGQVMSYLVQGKVMSYIQRRAANDLGFR